MVASEILVIILSIALAVFLALGIILVGYLIAIAQKIKRIADTAERTTAGFENIIMTFQKIAAPAVVSQFFMDVIARFTERRNKNKEDD